METSSTNNTTESSSSNSSKLTRARDARDLEYEIKFHRIFLKTYGIWMYSKKSTWINVRSNFLITFSILCMFVIDTIPQVTALLKVFNNLTLLVDNFTTNLSIILVQIKILTLWYKKKDLAEIFNEIVKNWYSEKTLQERDIMLSHAKLSRFMVIIGLGNVALSNIMFHGGIFFGVILRTISNITDVPDHPTTLQTIYFFDITVGHRYYLTVASQIISCQIAAYAYISVDVLFAMIVLHTCGQLSILANKIQNMVELRPFEEFQQVLKSMVKRYLNLIKFAERVENIFSMLLLITVFIFVLIFSILAFKFISLIKGSQEELPMIQLNFYTSYINNFLFLMFVYSWVGQKLINHNEQIHIAIYNCNWTSLTTKKSNELSIMLIRAQRPLMITIGKLAPVSLETYAQLLKTCGSYVSLLLAMAE